MAGDRTQNVRQCAVQCANQFSAQTTQGSSLSRGLSKLLVVAQYAHSSNAAQLCETVYHVTVRVSTELTESQVYPGASTVDTVNTQLPPGVADRELDL